MVEEVHHGGRCLKGLCEAVIIPHIAKSLLLCERRQAIVQRFPIAAVPALIDLAIQRHQLRVLFPNVVEYHFLVIPTQIQVFKPDQIALPLHSVDDRFYIGDTGKNRRDKTGRADARIVKRTILFRRSVGDSSIDT